jgi:hypothetical protein
MTAYQADRLLQSLVPLESSRPLPVPTLRFGRPAVVGVVGPKRKASDEPAAPTYWYVVDLVADELLAFARTSVMSPLPPSAARPPAPVTAAPMSFGEALAYLRESAESLRAAFFAGQSLEPGLAARSLAAYTSVIPARYLPWLRECCADFFRWLESAPE